MVSERPRPTMIPTGKVSSNDSFLCFPLMSHVCLRNQLLSWKELGRVRPSTWCSQPEEHDVLHSQMASWRGVKVTNCSVSHINTHRHTHVDTVPSTSKLRACLALYQQLRSLLPSFRHLYLTPKCGRRELAMSNHLFFICISIRASLSGRRNCIKDQTEHTLLVTARHFPRQQPASFSLIFVHGPQAT